MNMKHYVTILVSMVIVLCDSSTTKKTRKATKKGKDQLITKDVFMNSWAVRVIGDDSMAQKVASEHGFIYKGKVFGDVFEFVHRAVPRRKKRASFIKTLRLGNDNRVRWTQQQASKVRVKRTISFNDEQWKDQWYLHRTEAGFEGHDMNILPVWERGITGKGVVVSVLDDGIEYTHPELKDNYDPKASYDYNSNDTDPMPKYTWRDDNKHGTRCAGEIAATPNNTHCIVGVAYGSRIGGIRMLDGEITDMIEAQSLRHNRDYIDIYSSSWGPEDDGKTVDGPGRLTTQTLASGAKYGRKGKGNIFVWASGNGGNRMDYCNCDGYTNSIFTISVSTATSIGSQPWYLEPCASTLVATYSGGKNMHDKHIVTADLNGQCTDRHTGTSVAPPMVAGVVALALEVNPGLTWRDVQHLLVETSSLEKLLGDDFTYNAAGKRFSHSYGFGMVNAEKLVNLAEKWPTVGEQHLCENTKEIQHYPFNTFNKTEPLVIIINATGCRGTLQHIKYLEHVQVYTSLFNYKRGATEISIQSPKGTVSWVLKHRRRDNKPDKFFEWKFLSNHFWGEDPEGTWKVTFYSKEFDYAQGFLQGMKLIFYGTEQKPGEDNSNNEGDQNYRCHDECALTCNGPERHHCHRCKSFFYKDTAGNKHCVDSCPSRMYQKKGTDECLLCHLSCLKCSGQNETDCVACHSNGAMLNGRCTKDCPIGMFKTEDGLYKNSFHCQHCHKRCSACQGSSTNCSSCHKGSTLRGNMCVATCKTNQWLDGNKCKVCHETCKTCYGGSEYNCTSCSKKVLNDKHDRFLYKSSQCLAECPLGTYLGDTLMKDCLACPDHCLKCSNNGRKCDVCDMAHFLVSGTGSCVKECGEGYYMDIIKRTCEPCYLQCKSCVPGKPSACTSCRETFFLKEQSCVSKHECQTRYYVNYNTGRCDFCPVPCTFCKSPDKCTQCFLSYYLTPDHKCVEKCPTGTFATADQRCKACSADCSTCDGPTPFECTACPKDRYLLNGECKQTVPSGFYAVSYDDHKFKYCRRCHHFCEECNGPNVGNCTKCIGNMDMREKGCTNPCPGQWLSENKCENCDSTCLSCFGPSSRNCLVCNPGYLLNVDTYECTKVCPRMYYADQTTQTCKRCHQSCSTCFGPNPNQCTSCPWKLLFFNNTCSPECPSGWYSNIVPPTCLKCSSTCKSCKYQANLCTDCKKGQVWDDYKCFDKCGPRKYQDSKNKRCYSCHESCQTCNGIAPNECLTCPPGTSWSNGICLPGCLLGYYNSTVTGECTPCMGDCLQCTETTAANIRCKICSNSTVLQKDGTCSKSCPSGTYQAPYNNICKECPFKDCLECNARGKKCTKCKPLYAVSNGVCKSGCGEGTYQNFVEQKCSNCHRLCLACNGPTKHDCSQCRKRALTLLKRDKRISCVQECPFGYFKEDNFCLSCDVPCSSCETSHKCLSCNDGYVLQDYKCVTECSERYYHNKLEKKCIPCSLRGNCSKCSEEGCSECLPEASFKGEQCVIDCGDGFYSSQQECLQCSSIFENCNSCVEDKCMKCNEQYYLSNDICLKKTTTTSTTTTTTETTTTTTTTPTTTKTTPATTTTTPTTTTSTPTTEKLTTRATTISTTIPTTTTTTTPITTEATTMLTETGTNAATDEQMVKNSSSTTPPTSTLTTMMTPDATFAVSIEIEDTKSTSTLIKVTTPETEEITEIPTTVRADAAQSSSSVKQELTTRVKTTSALDLNKASSKLVKDTSQALQDEKMSKVVQSQRSFTGDDDDEDSLIFNLDDEEEGSTFLPPKKELYKIVNAGITRKEESITTKKKPTESLRLITKSSKPYDATAVDGNQPAKANLYQTSDKNPLAADVIVKDIVNEKTFNIDLVLSPNNNITKTIKLITVDPDNQPRKRSRRSVDDVTYAKSSTSLSSLLSSNIFLISVTTAMLSLCIAAWQWRVRRRVLPLENPL